MRIGTIDVIRCLSFFIGVGVASSRTTEDRIGNRRGISFCSHRGDMPFVRDFTTLFLNECLRNAGALRPPLFAVVKCCDVKVDSARHRWGLQLSIASAQNCIKSTRTCRVACSITFFGLVRSTLTELT